LSRVEIVLSVFHVFFCCVGDVNASSGYFRARAEGECRCGVCVCVCRVFFSAEHRNTTEWPERHGR